MPFRNGFYTPFILLFTPLFSQDATLPRETSGDRNHFTISTDVDLVILDVSVKDPKGGYVSGLAKENFRVYENNKLQTTTHFSHADIPVTVGLVIDNSGSMSPKRAEVVTAALTFVKASNPHDEVFVVTFNDKVRPGLPPDTPFTDDPEELRAALLKDESAGRTCLYDAIAYSLHYLDKGRRDKKTLVVVSDGGDNASAISWSQALRRTEESRATIYTIGIFDEQDLDRNPAVLRKLAQISGGEYFQLHNVDEIVQVCRKIASDIRNRYTIAYTPSHLDSTHSERRIKVEASDPSRSRLIVRTRSRYIMPERKLRSTNSEDEK
jgi:Ca-activated chloride channel family protein